MKKTFNIKAIEHPHDYYVGGIDIPKTTRIGHNQDLDSQIDCLERTLEQNETIKRILELAPQLQMPNWYLGAGCIAQTAWNMHHEFDLTHGIKDYDLVYYDSSDITQEGENSYIEKGRDYFRGLPIEVEIKNEARVHLWYEKHFGISIRPYKSIEEAINTWPTTATSVAVKYNSKGEFIIYAPYGLNDLFGMIVRPNKTQITKEIYLKKVERWAKIWPMLTIIPWA